MIVLVIGCWVLSCISILYWNSREGMIVFGALSLVLAYLMVARMRAGSTRIETHTTNHYEQHVTYHGPCPYLPDGTLSPFATPEAIQRFHASLGIPSALPPVEVRVPRECRLIEEPVVVHERYAGKLRPAPNERKIASVQIKDMRAAAKLPAPKKQSLIAALIMGPKNPK